ncbi:cache domain-containing protein [Roseateles sp.]|uniref:cache domain-containing protein n=1 Tax=Roseateles sp. TaxID=1971397 RepID=UPI003918A004
MKNLSISRAAALAVVSVTLSLGAQAQARGSKQEAVVLADAAANHVKQVGTDRAFKDFTHDKTKWVRKDLYVAVTDLEGKVLAHGGNERLIGKHMMAVRDATGFAFMARMIEVAKSPQAQGWVDYEWANPQTKRIEGKSSLVRLLPDGQSVMSVGYYR